MGRLHGRRGDTRVKRVGDSTLNEREEKIEAKQDKATVKEDGKLDGSVQLSRVEAPRWGDQG